MTQPFTLTMDQVPDPPESANWSCLLRWLIVVMDPADHRLPFIAAMYVSCLRSGGLSQPQAEACNMVLQDTSTAWAEHRLLCQRTAPDLEPAEPEEPAPMPEPASKRAH